MQNYDSYFDREYAQCLFEQHRFAPSAEEAFQEPSVLCAAFLLWINALSGVPGIRFDQIARLLLWWKELIGENGGSLSRKADAEALIRQVNEAWRTVLLTPRAQGNPALCMLILKRINDQYATLTLHSLAEQLDLNSTYLSRVISRDFKCSFPALIQCRRILRALDLLPAPRQTLSMEQIAGALGYSSLHYFYWVFKSYTRLTPAQAREVIALFFPAVD